MGIIDTIIRSRDDLIKPKKKSYWGYDLDVELVDAKSITQKVKLLPTEKRTIEYELSGKEHVHQLIILRNNRKSLGRLTTSQVKEILDDMGFNVDTILSAPRASDFSAVMNINGFAIPGWRYFVNIMLTINPDFEKLLLTKLAPGRERLHIRIFESNSGDWIILAHTDWNWMSLNLFRVYKAHVVTGAGDYEMGTLIMYKLLLAFNEFLKENKIFPTKDIIGITRWVYYTRMADSIKSAIKTQN